MAEIIDRLGADLKTAIGGSVRLYLNEAETESYPYAVYTREIEEKRTKDGIYRISSALTITVVAKTFSDLKTCSTAVRSAIGNLDRGRYVVAHQRSASECQDGIWTNEIVYNIHQNS